MAGTEDEEVIQMQWSCIQLSKIKLLNKNKKMRESREEGVIHLRKRIAASAG